MNWRHVAAPRAWQAFGELRLQLRDSNLPFQFFVQQGQTFNEAVIQIRVSQTHTACSTGRITRHGTPGVDPAILNRAQKDLMITARSLTWAR